MSNTEKLKDKTIKKVEELTIVESRAPKIRKIEGGKNVGIVNPPPEVLRELLKDIEGNE